MIKDITIFKRVLCWVSALAIIIVSPICHAQDPVSVQALAVHYAGNIQYSYRVSNHTRARSIVMLNIGDSGKQVPNPANVTNLQPELSVFPASSYWGPPTESGDQRGTSLRLGGIYTNSPGWAVAILGYEETTKFSIKWKRENKLDPGLLPGQTYNFSVSVPEHDQAYLNGHFTAGFTHSNVTDEGPAFWNFTGPIVSLDNTPPSLTVSLSPATLWPPNDKLVPITASITVNDDYDPAPEIKLESITANEVLDQDDVQGAEYTDIRQFQLKARRAGTNMAGRIYAVTYSATDATGNKSTSSATVTVPHDQGKK